MTSAHPTVTEPTRRGSKEDRREQLLDAAATLVVDKGLMGFTMEGLATAAGVSKALPYRHFANSESALLALLAREIGGLAKAIATACDDLRDGERLIAAAITAYFDVVSERGALLNTLAGSGSPLPELAGGGTRPAPWFVVDVIERGFGLRGQKATVLAWLITAMAISGSDSVARGDASRSVVQKMTISAAIGAAHAVVGERRT